MEIKGSRCLVTGASSGIGQATAIALAEAGARELVVVGRDAGRMSETLHACAPHCRTTAYYADLTDETAATSTARTAADVSVPDIVVNAAGAGQFLTLGEMNIRQAREMMAMPFTGMLYVLLELAPRMRSRGSGHIVNITSPAAIAPWPGATVYAASRWAVRGFTYALQQDLAGTGVGVTLVIPGKTDTAYFGNNPGAEERIPTVSRLVRTLQPSEVASAIVRAIEREQSEVIMPGMLRAFALMHRFFPSTVQYLIRRTGWQRP